MPSINVTGAAARLLANGVLAKAGLCLHYCWLAISQGKVHYITGGADTAYNTWLAVPADHRHSSRNVPKDFPAFLGKRFLSAAGDEIISSGTHNSAGELLFAATDWPKARQVGLCTLAQREKQTGRKFVGWASSQGGYELESTTTAGASGTPITEQEDDMSRLINHPDGSIALAGNDGTFVPLATMDEVASLRATGAVGDKSTDVKLADGLIWNLRTGIAARKAAQSSSNPAAVAGALAPLIIPAVIAAVAKVGSLTPAQVQAASEAAIRAVFADASK